jgi:predicted nuclease of restriction endonuclease-like (RecB) superfamily
LQNRQLYTQIADLLVAARQQLVRAVNTKMVNTYFVIGRMIVEDKQAGKDRAVYGKSLLINLSKQLSSEFGEGFSVDNLQNMRQLYLNYEKYEKASRIFNLSWLHYLKLMRINNEGEHRFYEIEPFNNNWRWKELNRQF